MPGSRKLWAWLFGLPLLVGGLALAGLYLIRSGRVPSFGRAEPSPAGGLAWLPPEAGLVGSIDLAALRQQAWLMKMAQEATAEVTEAADYRAFVEATGFDYGRDLDRVWFGLFGPSRQPLVTGVAEGRFARERILAYARRQGARSRRDGAVEIYEVVTDTRATPPAGRFAFAFLDDTHLAFGSDADRAALVVDCWSGRTPGVARDQARRQQIEAVAAGRQAWGVNDLARWQPPFLQSGDNTDGPTAAMTQLALGVSVQQEGMELAATAWLRDAQQAKRFADSLGFMLLAGRLALGREKSDAARALAKALGEVKMASRENTVEARVLLPPESLAALLRAAPGAATGAL